MSPFYDWVRGVLYPRKCMLCRSILQKDEVDLCTKCSTDVNEYPFGAANPLPKGKNNLHFLDSFTAVWYYEGNVRKSILRFKFQKAVYLAPKFGRFLAERIEAMGPREYDVLTWVPVSRLRRLKRGYDQCQLLAEETGRFLGIKPASTLRKIRNTPPQSGTIDHSVRKANVLGAFQAKPEVDLRGKVVLLLDDVYTTGATSDECARILLVAGAKEVHCAAIAAAPSHKK